MGRPKLTNTKDTFLHIRLNKSERQNMEDVCLQNNLSMSTVARQGIKKEIENIREEDLSKELRELDSIILNFLKLNKNADREVLAVIISLRDIIQDLIKGIKSNTKIKIPKAKAYNNLDCESLINLKTAITQFLDREEKEAWLIDPRLNYFKAIENWLQLQEILNRNNKTNSPPETKAKKETLSSLPTDTEDSGLDTSIRHKNNQTEFY